MSPPALLGARIIEAVAEPLVACHIASLPRSGWLDILRIGANRNAGSHRPSGSETNWRQRERIHHWCREQDVETGKRTLARAASTARSAQSGPGDDLPAQHRDLMPQDQDLGIFGGVAARHEQQPAENP